MGRINELRATPTNEEPTDAGRMRRALLPPQDIQRLECLCSYIREANGGLGMVRQLYAPHMLAEVKRCAFNLRLHRHAGHRNIGCSFDYGSTKQLDEIALVCLHHTWCKTNLRWIGDCAHFYSKYMAFERPKGRRKISLVVDVYRTDPGLARVDFTPALSCCRRCVARSTISGTIN